MAATTDRLREYLESLENEAQNAQQSQARTAPNEADKVQVKARQKWASKDRVRASAKAYGDRTEETRVSYEKKLDTVPKVKAQTAARGKGRPKKSDRVYDLRIKSGSRGKDRGGSLSGGVANLTSLGSLPEYTPPNFALKGSGYKPLDYKPISDAPMFKPTGFKTMDYKPMSAGSYYKPGEYKTIGNEPYYRPSQYQPIGQFGSVINNPPNISGLQRSEIAEPKKRKKKKKTKEPRLIGE